MNIIKTPYFPSKESFESYKDSPECQHWWYEKYLWWAARIQIIITLGLISPVWLFYYFSVINFTPFVALVCLNFSIMSGVFCFMFPCIWNSCKPKWVDDYEEKIKSKI